MKTLERPTVLQAIYKRRAVRDFTPERVSKQDVKALLHAAVQAPSAMNRQPWTFVVIQDPDLLAQYSARAKAVMLEHVDADPSFSQLREHLERPDYNIFYNAGTLIVIYAKTGDQQYAEDCCLAGQNLMLAAFELELGTCPIGLARPWLDLAKTKAELGIPKEYRAVMPIIVGKPTQTPPATPRDEPDLLIWKMY